MNTKKNAADSLISDNSSAVRRSQAAAAGIPAEHREKESFSIRRTVNGIPIAANDFPELCSIGDDDALRILLTARQRANSEAASGIPGENQIIH